MNSIIKPAIAMLLLVLLSPVAFGLIWADPYWMDHPSDDSHYMDYGESVTAASGAFRSYDSRVHFAAYLDRVEGSEREEVAELANRYVSMCPSGYDSCVTGFDTVSIDDSDYDYLGDFQVRFELTDRSGTQTEYLDLEIGGEYPNDAPIIDAGGDRSSVVGVTRTFFVLGFDPDWDDITFSATGLPDGAEFTQPGALAGRFEWTPESDQVGVHEITFTVTDIHGATDSETIEFTVYPMLAAEISVDNDEGTECDSFVFDVDVDSSLPISSIVWNYDDGVVNRGRYYHLVHRFVDQGTYDVRVTVTDTAGNAVSDVVTVNVSDVMPSVDLGRDVSITEGRSVTFDADAVSACVRDRISNYVWYFDDSTSASGATLDSVSHTFEDSGEFTVTVRVSDEDSTVSDSVIVTVGDTGPDVDFEWDPSTVVEEESVRFYDLSNSLDPIMGYEWDFDNDGVVDARSQNPSHTYETDDSYTACLTVTEWDGDEDTACYDIVVQNDTAPVVTFTSDVTEGNESLDVLFSCSFVDGLGDYDSTIFTGVGDEEISAGLDVDYTYVSDGDYTAECVVTDDDGDEYTETINFTVGQIAPSVELVLDITSGAQPLDVNALCNLTEEGNEPYNFTIDFAGVEIFEQSADYTFTDIGDFDVFCSVVDADGDTAVSETVVVSLTEVVLVYDFTWEPELPGVDDDVSFNAVVEPAGLVDTIEWDIDADGVTDDSGFDYVTSFSAQGDYDVTMTITFLSGFTDSVTHSVHVNGDAPEAFLLIEPVEGIEPFNFNITCNGTGGDGDLIFEVDNGEGLGFHEGEHHSGHDIEDGVREIVCRVTDEDGDYDIARQTVNISDSVPQGEITFTPELPGVDEVITFTFNGSAHDGITDVLWDFGEGVTSTEMEPTHSYDSDGSYTVNITVTDGDGSVEVFTVPVPVGFTPLDVGLTADPVSGTEPLTVDFVCGASGGDPIYNFDIDFGDGNSSVGSLTRNVYRENGTYTVTCDVVDSLGVIGSDTVEVVVSDSVPVITEINTDPENPDEWDSVTFNATVESYDYIVSWEWDFDSDGVVDTTDEEPVWTFESDGEHNVTVVVTDADGSATEYNHSIDVGNNPPIVVLFTDPGTGPEGVEITFNCTVVFGGDEPFIYNFDYGDGNISVSDVGDSLYVYPTPGTYHTSCTVTDADGDTRTSPLTAVIVNNNAPIVSLEVNTTFGVEGLDVDFNCSATDGDDPLEYVIDFDDGSVPVVGEIASHTYVQNGTYTATCNVTDADADVGADTVSIVVIDTVPEAGFVFDPVDPVEGDLVQFNDTSSSYDGVVDWSWDFDDGNMSNVSDPSHAFAEEGLYHVELVVTDADGSMHSFSDWVDVGDNVPMAVLSLSPTSGVEPLDVEVNCSVVGGNAPFTYDISYGDSVFGNESLSNYTYVDGFYNVICWVTDADGDESMDTASLTVNDSGIDFVLPVVGLVSPADGAVTEDDVTVEYTVTDDIEPVMTCDVYSNTSGVWQADLVSQATVNGASGNYSYLGLPDGEYIWNVECSDGTNSAFAAANFSFTVNSTADVTPPGTVSGLNESGVGSDWVEWSWTNPVDIDFDHVELWLNGSFVTNATGTSYNFTGLVAETLYSVEVFTVDNSDNRNSVGVVDNATTLAGADVTPPGTVSGLNESGVGSDWVEWSWINPVDIDFDHVELWLNGSFVTNATGTSYNFTGLVAETLYSVEVFTVDNSDNRNSTGVVDNATTLAGADVTPPGTVSGLNESGVGSDWVEWSWTNPVDIDFDHVELWLNGSFVTNATGTSYNFTGLVAETLYTVEVITVDSTGNRNSPGVMDNATTIPVDLFPVVSASASPLSGSLPLLVDFDANVTGGDAPVSIEWDFDSDGVVDSTSEDPSYVYNLAGDYTAVVNVTDADGDWASDSVNISVSGDTHDVAVLSVEHSKSLTTAYLWDVINVTSEVENQGTVAESVDVELEVDGVVVDTATVVIPVGVSVNTTLSFNATVEGFNTVVVRAVPVVGESDLSDQTESTSVRVWSVDDIVGMSTREIFLSTPVVAQGMSFTVFLPLQNDYALEEFQDMRVLMWSSNGTAFDVTDDLKFVDLGAGEMVLVEWSVTALPVGSGTYTISAVLGNDELDESNITSKMIMVV